MTSVYEKGDRIAITTSTPFQDASGSAFDPQVVTFKVTDPAGETTSYVYDEDSEVVKNDTGDYTCTIDVDSEGVWFYRIEGEQSDGENRGADEGNFKVVSHF